MEQVKQFINIICNELDITPPQLERVPKLNTATQLAAYEPDTNVIYIKTEMDNKLDLFFSIAHELRHAWQYSSDKEKFFDGYKSASDIDINDYNLQIAELDANAFGALAMYVIFGAQAQFDGFNSNIKERIYSLANDMSNIYFCDI